jgi:hypothetical protein
MGRFLFGTYTSLYCACDVFLLKKEVKLDLKFHRRFNLDLDLMDLYLTLNPMVDLKII